MTLTEQLNAILPPLEQAAIHRRATALYCLTQAAQEAVVRPGESALLSLKTTMDLCLQHGISRTEILHTITEARKEQHHGPAD